MKINSLFLIALLSFCNLSYAHCVAYKCCGKPVPLCQQFSRVKTTTDADITTNVQVRLAGDRGLHYLWIDVDTFNQVVTLRGNVDNAAQARAAICLAKSVPRVKGVRAYLDIRRNYDNVY